MFEKFTKQTAQSIMFGKEEAERLNNNYIGPEHLLLGLLRQGECDAVNILEKLHVDIAMLKREVEDHIRDKRLPDLGEPANDGPT